MKYLKLLYVFLCVIGLSGCVSSDPFAKKSYLYAAEVVLGTDTPDEQEFHAAVHYPFEYALRYPGMLVGIEKSAAPIVKAGVGKEVVSSVSTQAAPSQANGWLSDLMVGQDESKAMFISHIVSSSNRSDIPSAQKTRSDTPMAPCFLYNAYQPEPSILRGYRENLDSVSFCNGQPAAAFNNYFTGSWTAIERFKATLGAELASNHYTHVLVIVMGWNTEQSVAIRNFNSLAHRLAMTTSKEFRPYVIGVTWPSKWFGAIAGPFSLLNKANDADEIGAGWLGALFDYGIVPVMRDVRTRNKSLSSGNLQASSTPQVLVLGHSFGARATSHAVCRGTMLKNPPGLSLATKSGSNSDPAIDALIALEGAYSLDRFTIDGAGPKGLAYNIHCPEAKTLIFTASANDSAAEAAASVIATGNFAGTIAAFKLLQEQGLSPKKSSEPPKRFATYTAALAPGEMVSRGAVLAQCGPATDMTSRFRYIDATKLIYFNGGLTSSISGAHGDIYRNDTARMLWNMLDPPKTCE